MKLFKHLTRSINLYKDYNKAISDLARITGNNPDIKYINDCLKYQRKIHKKKRVKYPGDHIIIDRIKDKVCLGFTLEDSILIVKYDSILNTWQIS